MSPETLTLTAGGATGTLTVTFDPTNATNKNVTWTTSNPEIATVENGVVKGIKAGTATITATSNNGKTATAIVTVEKEVEKSTATITLDGETDHSNDKYGNEVTLGADLKVTGTLKYHETDPTGMGFAAYDKHFMVFTIKDLPETGAEVTIKGLAEGTESSTTYTFTSASDVVVWGVEANENIEITVNYGDGFEAMVYTLDLSGVELATE